MKYRVFFRRWAVPWDIILTVCLGAFLFVFVAIASSGIFMAAVITALAMVAFGLVQYFLWGRNSLRSAAPERAREEIIERQALRQAIPADEFTIPFNERERQELLAVLEESLAAPVEAQPAAQRALRLELLDRLRGFGA
jgi:hypothetical protein